MSGPIIRKYGFPNFDQIFGKKELEHGVDAGSAPAKETPEAPASQAGTAVPRGEDAKKPGGGTRPN